MSDQDPYKDVPPEDFIKAVRLMLLEINDHLIQLLRFYLSEEEQDTLMRFTLMNRETVCELLRARTGVCSSRKAPASKTPSSPDQCRDVVQSDPLTRTKTEKDC